MILVGEDPKKYINDYSNQFQRDFLQLLRTSHGEKKVSINGFYQEYIANKQHIHMNATRWPSLTEFAKYLGREGICRVEETDKGLHISWIDNSPEALRRQDAIRKKERQDKGDEEREQKLIQEQIERAQQDTKLRDSAEESEAKELWRVEGEKIKLDFGSKLTPAETSAADSSGTNTIPKVSASLDVKKPKNVFATVAKKNPLASKKNVATKQQAKPMSEAERIMKEEIERKRAREEAMSSGTTAKKQKLG